MCFSLEFRFALTNPLENFSTIDITMIFFAELEHKRTENVGIAHDTLKLLYHRIFYMFIQNLHHQTHSLGH